MEILQQMINQLSKKYQDSWTIHKTYVDVNLRRRKRHHRVHLKREGDYYTFLSVIMDTSDVMESTKSWNELAVMAWCRNADHEIVSFAFDHKEQLVGVIRHPAKYLDPEELEIYITALVYECDRFEFLISGRDRF